MYLRWDILIMLINLTAIYPMILAYKVKDFVLISLIFVTTLFACFDRMISSHKDEMTIINIIVALIL